MPKVPTTFSLATRPVTVATAPCQLPQPRGAKRKATAPPTRARMLLSIATMPKRPSSQPKPEANQMKMVDRRMTVPAFLMKLQPRSHMERRRFFRVGMW